MKKNILLILTCILLVACSETKQNRTAKIINIDLDNVKDNILLNAEELKGKYIFLETNDSSVIGHIDKMAYVGDKIYILDMELSKSLFIFDNKGKFITKISNVGQGPGEFIEPNDFIVYPSTQEILILDDSQQKIIHYNNYKFSKETKTKGHYYNFMQVFDNIIARRNYCEQKENCFEIIVYNNKLNVKTNLFPFSYKSDIALWELDKSMTKHNDILYLSNPYSNSINMLNNNLELTEFCYFNFGNDSLDIDVKTVNRQKFLDYIRKTDKAFLIDNFMRANNFMFFNFFYKHNLMFCFSNIDGSKIILSNMIMLSNEVTALNPLHINEKYMFFGIEAASMIDNDKVDDTDNPIILQVPIEEISKYIVK